MSSHCGMRTTMVVIANLLFPVNRLTNLGILACLCNVTVFLYEA